MRTTSFLLLLLVAVAGCGKATAPSSADAAAIEPPKPVDIAAILPKGEDLRQYKTEGDPKLYSAGELKDFDPAEITRYTGYGFARLAAQTYIRATDGMKFTAAVYDMVQPINAFGLYMSLTDEKAAPLKFVKYGQLHENKSRAEFQKGDFFVRVTADEPSTQNDVSARGLARRVSEKVPATQGEPVDARLALLPDGYLPQTVRYRLRGAFAHKFLQDTIEAGYPAGRRKPGRMFYARMESEEAAVMAMSSLRESYKKSKVRVRDLAGTDRLGTLAFAADDVFFGRGIFFQSGPYVGGMFGAGKSEQALSRVQALAKNIAKELRAQKRRRR